MRVLLPLIDLSSGRAVCATLSVCKGRYSPNTALDEAALRDAWRAACKLNGGKPRWMFEKHEFSLSFRGQQIPADGRSLGLAAGVALWALWADLPQSRLDGVGATGTLSAGARVGLIQGVDDKIEAVNREGATILIPEGQREHRLTDDSLRVVSVSDLRAAGEQLGLPPLDATPEYTDLDELEEQLQKLSRHVTRQRLTDYRNRGLSPWIALARELEGWASMHPDRTDELVQQAFLRACEAYMYAGDLDSAFDLVERLDAGSRPEHVSLLQHELTLRRALTETAPDPSAVDRLIAKCSVSPPADRFHANRLGTLGRAYVHTGRPEQGLPLLQQARDQQIPMEVGRSEVYLAMAHRVAGDFEAAHEAMERALKAHETDTRRYCEPYYRSCILYWEYEMVRLLIEQAEQSASERQGKALRRKALEHARMALGCCDELGEPVWPRVGILRLLAWADYHSGTWQKQLRALAESYELAEGTMYRTLFREGLDEWSADALIW